MLVLVKIILIFNYFTSILCANIEELTTKVPDVKNFVIWPNATIPFYIDPDHFDNEQSISIMRALSTFAFKTCLKFVPVMTRPQDGQHVMMFVNPNGIKRCYIDTDGPSVTTPHMVHVGYKCLKSPNIDMMIMRALGFNFEHNKFDREKYISVIRPHIDPAAFSLFVEDVPLPPALQDLPYDMNSVMHFGERDYSRNGYRTIKFKPLEAVADHGAVVLDNSMSSLTVKQNRTGLTALDLKKIDIVYGPECLKRDRQEKIEICQSYPGIVRKKRNAEVTPKSLRVNRDITPPSIDNIEDGDQENEVSKNLKELGVEEEAQNILEHVYKVSSKALEVAREKYCNGTEYKPLNLKKEKRNSTDIIGILEYITDYVDSMVSNALRNLTVFCENPVSILGYQRQNCNWRFDSRCVPTYRSTKSGSVFYTTQHRPYIVQSTWHKGQARVYAYDKPSFRSKNDSEEITSTTKEVKSKREAFNNGVEKRNRKNNSSKTDRKRRYSGGHYGVEKPSQEIEHDRPARITAPSTVALSKLNREFYTQRMWPEGVVRYVITPLKGYDLEDMRSRLAEVNEILKKKTCVKLEEVSEEEAMNHEDYLVLDASSDYITGRVGGKQVVSSPESNNSKVTD